MKLLHGIVQRSPELLQIDRLEQIIFDAECHAFLKIAKFIIPAEDNHLHPRLQLADSTDQIQPVHERHGDVGNQNIRAERGHSFQGFLPILGPADNLHAHSCPIDDIIQTLDDKRLIIHNEYLIHRLAPPLPNQENLRSQWFPRLLHSLQ
ncbi:hypothetical protein D3C75_640010 [compost metagenome]